MRAPLAVAVVVAALFASSSCRDPTEITLRITSNTCATLTQTGIAVGPIGDVAGRGFSATQAGCPSAGYVGSIVVLPSNSPDDSVGIEVIGGLGKDPSTCTHADPQCIVARRSLHYLPHTPLTLPIALEASCAGVACDDPSTTCLSGACVPSAVDPNACLSGGCALDAGIVDASPLDATVLDASPPDAAVVDAGGAVLTLATGQAGPAGIVVDATSVYWTNFVTAGTVMKCAIGGCLAQPTIVASGQPGAFDLTADATNVYWTNFTVGGQVTRGAKAGGLVAALATGLAQPYGIATVGGVVYWAHDNNPGTVAQCLTGGCNNIPSNVATGQGGPSGVAVDGTGIYWANATTGEVMRCALPCASPVALATNQSYPLFVALDATNVYWTNFVAGTIMKCSKSGCGTPQTLASGQVSPRGIAVDTANVYWTTIGTNGTVMKCAVSGCVTPTTLASNLKSPYGVAVDATSVYWTNNGAGTVVKLTPK